MLNAMGATQAQGFLLSRPCTLQALEKVIGQWKDRAVTLPPTNANLPQPWHLVQ
jgi:hypothetical protein